MEKKVYQTSDINIAATLLSLNLDVIGIDPSNPDRVVFYFDENSDNGVAALVSKYWRGDLSVEPKSFMNCRRDLISRIKEAERNMKGY